MKLLTDLLNSKQFKIFLNDAIEEETHRRNNRMVVYQANNLDLRRNTFVSLDERGLMTVEWLTAQFELIEAKTSELTAHERQLVWLMVDTAILNTLEYNRNRPIQKVNKYFKRILKLS